MRASYTPQHRAGDGAPLVLLHGFTDTWRTWDLVRPQLERHYDVLAPTLLGHAGGPVYDGEANDSLLADAVERAMDEAGFETAHLVGNSLGGYVALHLAERGRARSVTALAPAGGWPDGDASFEHACRVFVTMQRQLVLGAPLVGICTRTRAGRRFAMRVIARNWEHVPRELIVHMARGARACPIARQMLAMRDEFPWHVDGERIDCPVRVVWGTEDRVLTWPVAATTHRAALPDAEWIELEGVGHCPQLDVPERVIELVREQVEAVEAGAAVGFV